MKQLMTLFLSVNIYSVSFAQAIRIGQAVPPLTLPMLQYSSSKVNLQDFKGRLIILDFWASSCSVCLAQFPKLEELQKEFGDSIFILPVGFDGFSSGSVAKCIEKRKGTSKEIKLPTAVQGEGDSLLFHLFPFEGVPNEVWISPDGKLLGVTDQIALTENHIREAFSRHSITAREKTLMKDFPMPDSVIFRSLLLPWDPAYGSRVSEETNMKYTRIAIPNQPIWMLAVTAFLNSQEKALTAFKSDNLFKLVLAEGDAYTPWHLFATNELLTLTDSFQQKYCVSYESLLPPGRSIKQAYKVMLNELMLIYHLSAKIEISNTKCFFITRIPSSSKKEDGLILIQPEISDNYQDFSITNGDVQKLVSWCNGYLYVPLLFCDLKGAVTVHVKLKNLNDMASLQLQLSRQGFMLTEKTIAMRRLVIKQF